MNKRLQLVLGGFLAVIIGAWLAFRPEPRPNLRIAINNWPGYEFLYLAHVKGFFHNNGLDTKILEYSSLNDLRRAFERGQVDIMASTMIEQIVSRDKSQRRAQALIVSDYSDGSDVVIALKGISSVKELKGKRVGFEAGTVGIVLLKLALEREGMSISDVSTINVPQDDAILEELRSGSLDAVVSYPSVSFKILKGVPSQVIFSSKDIPAAILDIISADESFIRENPQAIESFRKAYFQALDYAKENQEESYKIMAARENISLAEFRQSLESGIVLLGKDRQSEFLRKGGIIERVAPAIVSALAATNAVQSNVDISNLSNSDE